MQKIPGARSIPRYIEGLILHITSPELASLASSRKTLIIQGPNRRLRKRPVRGSRFHFGNGTVEPLKIIA
jgi:hypothetical protein